MTSFDDILKTIGEFGPFQKRVYVLLCFPGFTLSALLVAHVFILGVPDHRCKIPGLDNDTYAVQDTIHEQLVNATIPLDDKGNYDKCKYISNNNVTISCSEWVYDDSVYKMTFARKLDMVCDDSIKIPNAQMVFYFGVLVGSFVYGQLSDIIGRRKAFYLGILVLFGSSCGLVGMVEYIGFCVLLFLIGGACLGLYLCSYVISMEMVGPSKRVWTGNIIQMFLTTGVMLLTLLVYLIRDWRYFTLAIGLQCVLFLPYYWFVCSMSYYGTVMNIDNLSGDFFLNFSLMTVVEYPAKMASMLLLDRIGRKRLHMAYLFIGGVASMATMWPIMDGSDKLHPVLITFALIGKMCMVGAFGTIYVLSTESFPTVVRNAGMGASSAIARVGSMIAPYIAKSATLVGGPYGQAIPLTLFGAAMFLAGLSTILLPETLNRQLPESIEDAINIKKRKKNTEKEVSQMATYENGVVVDDEMMERDKL